MKFVYNLLTIPFTRCHLTTLQYHRQRARLKRWVLIGVVFISECTICSLTAWYYFSLSQPTLSPSDSPSESPSASPTSSSMPSSQPSSQPSISLEPTELPTRNPTSSPTKEVRKFVTHLMHFGKRIPYPNSPLSRHSLPFQLSPPQALAILPHLALLDRLRVLLLSHQLCQMSPPLVQHQALQRQ